MEEIPRDLCWQHFQLQSELEQCHNHYQNVRRCYPKRGFPRACVDHEHWNYWSHFQIIFYSPMPSLLLPQSWKHELRRRKWPNIDALLDVPSEYTYQDNTAQPELFWNLDLEEWDAVEEKSMMIESELPIYISSCYSK